MNLLKETKALLRKHRKDLTTREIAVGAKVGFQWLMKFAQGKIPDPGVSRVQKLYDFLSAREDALRILRKDLGK